MLLKWKGVSKSKLMSSSACKYRKKKVNLKKNEENTNISDMCEAIKQLKESIKDLKTPPTPITTSVTKRRDTPVPIAPMLFSHMSVGEDGRRGVRRTLSFPPGMRMLPDMMVPWYSQQYYWYLGMIRCSCGKKNIRVPWEARRRGLFSMWCSKQVVGLGPRVLHVQTVSGCNWLFMLVYSSLTCLVNGLHYFFGMDALHIIFLDSL